MRILVTGSRGFLGRHLGRALGARGDEVVPLDRDASPDRESLRRLLAAGFDAVCHLAAHIPSDHDDPDAAWPCLQGNALLTLDLLSACVAARVPRFVHTSTGSAYAEGPGSPAAETEPLRPSRRAPYYLGSKVLAETWVEHFRLNGLGALTLRLSAVYGREMPDREVIPTFIRHALAHEPLEVRNPSYRSDYVYVADVVGVILAALTSGEPGVYNVGSGIATTLADLARAILAATGRDGPIVTSPTTDGSWAGHRPLAIDQARATWGFSPTPLRDGLRDMVSGPR